MVIPRGRWGGGDGEGDEAGGDTEWGWRGVEGEERGSHAVFEAQKEL